MAYGVARGGGTCVRVYMLHPWAYQLINILVTRGRNNIRRALCVCVVVGCRWCMGWLEGGTCVCGYMLHVVGVPVY